MGGFGSGRTGGKPCTDGMRHLDIRTLKRKGYLVPGRHALQWVQDGEVVAGVDLHVEQDRVTLSYNARAPGQDWRAMHYAVELDRTPCTFGGVRLWWRCPAVGCGRRVAVLYGGAVFACRHCHQLAYRVQRETADDRAGRRADKIRDRLGWEAGILNPAGRKPKGMHWRTFWKLRAEHDAHVQQSLMGIAQRFNLHL